MQHEAAINQDGLITRGTTQNLIDGLRSDPITREAVEAVMGQAAQFVGLLVTTYSNEVAAGEVGVESSAKATGDIIEDTRTPRVLLYGRVQSGKTVAMILSAVLALDNGFRVVVVLTSDNVELVNQTTSRFKNLDGPRVFSGAKDGTAYEWEGQEDQLRDSVATDGLVLICAKNAFNLPQVLRFLMEIDASSYPTLIMDDEADAATPDTTLAARSAEKPNAPAYASTIHRLVVANDHPNEEDFSLGEMFPHGLYVQVTATPYVLLLQTQNADMRPTVIFVLEPGQGYCGGDVFFGKFDEVSANNPQPNTVVIIADNEAALMTRQIPAGLAKSINFFVLSSCARAITENWPQKGKGFKHLSHTSSKINDHELVSTQISSYIKHLRDMIRDREASAAYFADAYRELQRSLGTLAPPLDDLIGGASIALRQAEIVRVNSKADEPAYGPRLNFVIGGNILGRGLTIDDLLVTYYIREAKTSQMDTVWQHARMFGYRQRYLNYVRVFLPHRLGVRFKQIHEAEEALRQGMLKNEKPKVFLIKQPAASRPTRTNALEAGALRAISANRDQIFPTFLKNDPEAASSVLRILQENKVPIEGEPRTEKIRLVPFASVTELIAVVATNEDDPGLWHREIIQEILNSYESIRENCYVYARKLTTEPPTEGWTRGRLSGPEITLMREAAGGAPALALLYHGDAANPDAWYPTLVMPPETPALIFTYSSIPL